MKHSFKKFVLSAIALSTSFCILAYSAPSSGIYSVSTCPGEDASTSVGISWGADLNMRKTYVLYTTVSDSNWKKAVKVRPEQKYECDVFDGYSSVDADRNDIVENVKFTKCGATLRGLRPDTDYKYVVKCKDGTQSKEMRFRTAGADSWSCCLISDFHAYPPLPKRLDCSMAMIDKIESIDPSLDWILSAGDVVAWGASYSFWKGFFDQDNCSEFMWARANGNHDNWSRVSIPTGNIDMPNDFFKGTAYYPQNGYKGQEGVCYHFRYGNTLFVVLNTEDMHNGEELDNAIKWTREVISKEKSGSTPPVFTVVCMHYQWFFGTNGKADQYRRWHSVFDELGVDLAYAGNNHVYVRTLPLYDGKVSSDGKGTVYIQTPASDNERGRNIEDGIFENSDLIAKRWTEGSHSVGAVLMSVDNKEMKLTLYDRNGTAADSTIIYAK